MVTRRSPRSTKDRRAFRRDRFFSRTGPLAAASGLALVLLLGFGPAADPALLARALAGFVLVWSVAWLVPWHRLPRWTDAIPPLMLLGLFAGLRLQVPQGLPAATLAPLFLIPTFWVALFGTLRDVIVLVITLFAIRVIPSLARGDLPDLAHGVTAVLVSAAVSFLTYTIVRRARDAEESLRATLDRLPVGYVIVAGDVVSYANDQVATMLGYASRSDLVGVDVKSILHADERTTVDERIRGILAGGERQPSDRRLLHRAGGEVVVETTPFAITFGGERSVGVIVRDVTDERHLASVEEVVRERVARERARFEGILAAVRDGVALIDKDLRGLYANRAYLELFGLSERQFVGMGRDAFVRHAAKLAADPEAFAAKFAPLLAEGDPPDTLFVFSRPRRRVMRRTVRPIELADSSGFLVVWHDVTADHDLVDERERLALTDPLTGLANRRAAEQALAREVARARRHGTPLSICLLDLDRFKAINDGFGHEAGDRVLATFATVLQGEARITDVVARWGGEEFLAILPGDRAGARAFYDRVRAALGATPVEGVGRVTVSAGVATLAPDEEIAATLRRADEALYAAKRDGRDRAMG